MVEEKFVYFGGKKGNGFLILCEKKEIDVGGVGLVRKKGVRNFKKVHKKTFVKKGKVYAKEKICVEEIFESARKVGEEMGVEFQVV